MYGLLQ